MFAKVAEDMRESSDRLDGYLTGRLIVEGNKVHLVSDVIDKTVYTELTVSDHIEIRN
ncbi:hypothetical protein [Bacillus sp. FSL K6-3431]|uniref:hypothetical protein n=1 Tax=Bacillus sp. FSL K6-3431 TaxID=2921500 RepID=UPI0030F83729